MNGYHFQAFQKLQCYKVGGSQHGIFNAHFELEGMQGKINDNNILILISTTAYNSWVSSVLE